MAWQKASSPQTRPTAFFDMKYICAADAEPALLIFFTELPFPCPSVFWRHAFRLKDPLCPEWPGRLQLSASRGGRWWLMTRGRKAQHLLRKGRQCSCSSASSGIKQTGTSETTPLPYSSLALLSFPDSKVSS